MAFIQSKDWMLRPEAARANMKSIMIKLIISYGVRMSLLIEVNLAWVLTLAMTKT